MKRLFINKLIQWNNQKSRKPLIVRGARQVGKSHLISHFGNTEFEGNLHVINLEKHPDWHIVFNKNLDVKRILSELEVLLNKSITPGKDLLFFDEVQECPNAILALRYFYEDMPSLHVIAAGSLLEFSLGDLSFPVGRIQLEDMYPMTFYEFLLALKKDQIAKIITSVPKEISNTIDLAIKEELKNYFFVGGMPECVKKFRETNSFTEVFKVQSDLISTFKQDFEKYAPKVDKNCMISVLNASGKNVSNQIKYSKLAQGYTNPTIKNAFQLLVTARLFHRVAACSTLNLPLKAHASSKKFKIVMLDIGLLNQISGVNIKEQFLKKDLSSMFRGILAEQFVGQELLASGKSLFYWSRDVRNSSAEVDYLIEHKGKAVPVEVKSGSIGKLKSLHQLNKDFAENRQSFVFSEANYGAVPDHKVTFVPLYFAGSYFSEES